MSQDIINNLITAGSGIVGALIGAAITYLSTRRSNNIQQQIADAGHELQRELAKQSEKAQNRATIDGLVIKMIELALTYPYLEKEEFCHAYPNGKGHPHCKERYDNYCCFVFNTLMSIFKHFGEEGKMVGEYIHIEEIMALHYQWWNRDKQNLEYDEPFRQYIQSVIDQLRKKGVIKE